MGCRNQTKGGKWTGHLQGLASSPGAFLDLSPPLYGPRQRVLQADKLIAHLEESESSTEDKG